jgi:hypothetical protein
MGKEFLPVFLDFNETTQDLNDEQCGRLIRALVDYANGKDRELSGMELMAFRFLKGSIDRNKKLSAIRSEAGSQGGRPKAKESKENQTKANESKTKQNAINNNNDNKTNNDNNNKEDRFARFWAIYPRHVAKPNARKAFDKLNPDDVLLETMIRSVEQQKQSDQWIRDNGQYIPHPATWINQRRWEDEVKPVAVVHPAKTVTAQQYSQRDYADEQEMAFNRMIADIKKGAG